MSPYRAHGVACLVSMALVVSCTTPDASEPQGHVYVQFTGAGVNPETARISADGKVTWVNAAADYEGTVAFPESMAASFTCGEDLGRQFRRSAAGYQSLPMDSTDSAPVTLPCPLKPGSYTYEIWLVGTGFGEQYGNPARKIRGMLVVE